MQHLVNIESMYVFVLRIKCSC